MLLFSALSAQAVTRPNIVFILADDLNQEVFSHTSRIHSLIAAKGVTFNNHFVSLSLCCPSRTATLRGQFAHNTGVYTNALPNGGFEKVYGDGLEGSTVATWLKDSGYRTALFGKYLNGYPSAASGSTYIPPGWTRWISPNGGVPYSKYNYILNQNGKTVSYGSTDADYLEDVLSNHAVTFIKDTTTYHPDQPFFLYIAPYIPHRPATPPSRYANDFPGIQAPRSDSFNEADVTDKPAWIQNKPLLTPNQIANIDNLYRKQRQSIQALEDLVEHVVNTLQATGQLNNTYIFFSSDNGFHQGQHRLDSGKDTGYETDLKVPLVVRGPGIPAGQVVNHLTANVDYAPTFAEIAGVTPPDFVDGRSLVPFLAGATPSVWRQVLLLEHAAPSKFETASDVPGTLEPRDPYDVYPNTGTGQPVFTGLRTSDPIDYIEYDNGEHELYYLATDPKELNNAYNTANPALKTKLTKWLHSLRDASGQALRIAEQNP